MTPYLTILDVCRLLSVSRRTVYEWMRTKRLAHFRVGRVIRFQPQVVEAFIASRTVKARFSAAHGQGLVARGDVAVFTERRAA